ncbi:Virulence sensor protein BvgS precursor [compost metagenome]|jgi:two-component system sensor histidine kinase EvgS
MDDCLFKPLSLGALSQWVQGIEPTHVAPAFSLHGLKLLTGGNPKLNRRLLNELVNSNRQDLPTLLSLSSSGDTQALQDIAHKIKGAARIVQASRLIDRCEALEAACHEDSDREKVAGCCKSMERTMLELEDALLRQIEHYDEGKLPEP